MSSRFFSGLTDELVKLSGATGKAIYDKDGKYVGFKQTGTSSEVKPKPVPAPPAAAPAPTFKTPRAVVPKPGSIKAGGTAVRKGLHIGSRQKGIGKYLP